MKNSLVFGDRKPRIVGIYRLTMKADSDNFRYSAIQALGASATKESKEMIIYYLNQIDYKKLMLY